MVLTLDENPPALKRLCVGDCIISVVPEEPQLGWSNFPVVVQHEAHPSETARTPAEQRTSSLEPDVRLRTTYTPTEAHDTNKRKTHPVDEIPASFGWGDFPLVETSPAPTIEMFKDDETRNFGSGDVSLVVEESFPATPAETVVVAPHRPTRIQFTNVYIREYAVQLGDHPLCDSYPVSLDWAHSASPTLIAVDDYERSRRNCCWDRKPRRMDAADRRSKLGAVLGISQAEVDVLEKRRYAACNHETSPELARVPTLRLLHEDEELEYEVVDEELKEKHHPIEQCKHLNRKTEGRNTGDEEDFLDMNIHITCHTAVDPGFETQLL